MTTKATRQMPKSETRSPRSPGMTLHALGVICGLAAGIWLGAAEAPTKLVTIGLSPYSVSLCMVAGVFTARWTFPTLLKGTGYVFADLLGKKHLIIWALLAGALWAVANTLTVFAIRDVGLAVAFPLWNANALVGLLWGRLLFRELQGSSRRTAGKVVAGAVAIVAAAIMLGFSTLHGGGPAAQHATRGLVAALGASLMWGTMYVPYRKAYLSGMNPLSFVTAFTVGELITVLSLAVTLGGGAKVILAEITAARSVIFWLFLGGFVWVVGDLFQQFATKYLGIGRGIPLSNTNQLWGLAWGALVFGELTSADRAHRLLVVGGSLIMIVGALAISTAVADDRERNAAHLALLRECRRYGLDYDRTLASISGAEIADPAGSGRRWWDYLIVITASGVFLWLGMHAVLPPLAVNLSWVSALAAVLIVSLLAGGWSLWRRTDFS